MNESCGTTKSMTPRANFGFVIFVTTVDMAQRIAAVFQDTEIERSFSDSAVASEANSSIDRWHANRSAGAADFGGRNFDQPAGQ